jgi:hypothetical protein
MKASIEHKTPTGQKKFKRKYLTFAAVNEANRHLADTWTPEMDEEIERATRQYWLDRCAKLTEEKLMRTQQRAQLKRELKKAVTVKFRSDEPGVDAELARIRAALADLEMHELNATAERRVIRAELRKA